MKNYIGIDIGGTKCSVVLGNRDGKVLDKIRFQTEDVHKTLDRIISETESMAKRSPLPVASVGISCGGPLDPKRGIIQSPPNLPGWNDIEIVRMIREHAGIPAVLCNDANACALAEWQFGAGRGTENMIFLTFGTGMGAGIIIGGRIYNGTTGNAGEIGHVRLERFGPIGYGKRGSFEGFVSGGGIAMMAKSAAIERLQRGETVSYCNGYDDLNNINARSVALAAQEGDQTAVEVYRLCGEMLGRGLAILVDVLNPERIVIGSIFQRSSALLRESMEKVLREECLSSSLSAVQIVPAELGEDIGDRAALSLAISIEK